GNESFTAGSGTSSEGDSSIAMGTSNTIGADGDSAVALGSGNGITAVGAVALGTNNTVSGTGGFAGGSNNIVLGFNATALGLGLRANSYAETVIGYNSSNYVPSSTTSAVGTDRLFVVANNTLGNAMTLLKNGRLGLSRIPITNILEVEGNASKNAAGDWLANSDRRLKKNIKTFTEYDALHKLLQMRGVTYEWNDKQTGTNRPKGQQYGFVAQELMEVFPENVVLDNQGFYQTAYGTYDALYVQSIKALHNKIEILEQENKVLKTKLEELYEMVKANASN
ncbi:tail fiber domain-containing protein, partial [Winogradskyella luteola]